MKLTPLITDQITAHTPDKGTSHHQPEVGLRRAATNVLTQRPPTLLHGNETPPIGPTGVKDIPTSTLVVTNLGTYLYGPSSPTLILSLLARY